jgi:acyl-CoA synthetase (AMP-forming)/AMP-acid ligase II/acyl carrier protein
MNQLRPRQGFPTFVELLRHRAALQGDRTAFVYLEDGERPTPPLTYRDLEARARAVAARLQADGLAGHRALLMYPAGLDFLAAFLGCLHAGVVAVPLAPPAPSRLASALPRLRAVVQDAEPSVLLTTERFASAWHGLGADTPSYLRVLATDTFGEEGASAWRYPSVGPKSVAMLQYTSGSTGSPRGVVLTHRHLLDQTAIIRELFGFTHEDSGCSWLPVFHDMGLIGMVLQPIDTCSPVTLLSPVAFLQRPFCWLKAISDARATFTTAPNFAYDLCVRKARPADVESLDLSHWRRALVGAEPVRERTLRRFHEIYAPRGFRWEAFFPCYGLAETTLAVSGSNEGGGPCILPVDGQALEQDTILPPRMGGPGPRLVSAGVPSSIYEVVIVDPGSHRRCSPNRVGEIWVKGGSVAAGYWRREAGSTAAAPFEACLADCGTGPFLRTGDLGFLHDGHLFITGRCKDLIILAGRNLYPQDIEATAEAAHPAVRPGSSAAFAVDVENEEQLVLVVEIEDARRRVFPPCDPAEVIRAIRRSVSEAHDAGVWDVVLLGHGQVPKTSSGKIQRQACKAAYLAGSWQPVGRLRQHRPAVRGGVQAVEHILIQCLARALELPAETIDPDEAFAAYGLDSRSGVGLVGELEVHFGRKLPATLFWDYPTTARLAAFLTDYTEAA